MIDEILELVGNLTYQDQLTLLQKLEEQVAADIGKEVEINKLCWNQITKTDGRSKD